MLLSSRGPAGRAAGWWQRPELGRWPSSRSKRGRAAPASLGWAARGVPSGTSGGRQPCRLLCLRAAGTGSVETAQAVPSGRASFESGSRAGAGRPCTAYLRPPTSGRGPKCGAWFCRWFLILFTLSDGRGNREQSRGVLWPAGADVRSLADRNRPLQ